MPGQLDIIRRHIDDAIARGGRALVGGPGRGRRALRPADVLVDVPKDSSAWTEETFGPTMTVAKVKDMDEAVARDQRLERTRSAPRSSPSPAAMEIA